MTTRATGKAGLAFAFAPEPSLLFAPEALERLSQLCSIIDPLPLRRLDDNRAHAALADVRILVTGWGCPPLDEAVLAHAPRLKLVAHAAGSVRALVSPAVFSRGITVVGAADANALPVAEFTLAAILFTNKRVLDFAALYRRERRGLGLYLAADRGIGNWRKTIGVVGASRIGRRVIELLAPFDVAVVVYDPFLSTEAARALGAAKAELDDLLRLSDVVSLHAPSLPTTRHMLDARRLGLMRDGATLINTARGALVEESALVAELVSGRLSAVLDVTDPDVAAPDSPLYDLPNVLLTPHIAGAMGDERHRFGRLIAGEIERFLDGAPLQHAIDPKTLQFQA